MTESALQRAILDALAHWPDCHAFRVNAGSPIKGFRGAPKGTADIIGIIKGRFFALEVKLPKKKPSKHQVEFLRLIRSLGGIAEVVHNVDEALHAVRSAD